MRPDGYPDITVGEVKIGGLTNGSDQVLSIKDHERLLNEAVRKAKVEQIAEFVVILRRLYGKTKGACEVCNTLLLDKILAEIKE